MIEFKDITLADKDLIQSFTLGSLRRNCDLSFANLCSWIFLYQTKYAVMDNYLLLRFYAGEELAYMMPVGTGDVKPVLEALIKDAEEMGAKLRMLGVCVGMKADIEAAMPGRFTFTEDRDYFDYIYLRTDLATLKGKKFQAKRNHINKFKKQYPDYEYKPLTPDLVPECLKLVSLFYLMPSLTNGIQGGFRGLGDLKITLNSSTLNMAGRVAAAALFVLLMKMDIEALPYSYVVGWILMLVYEAPMMVKYLRKGEL